MEEREYREIYSAINERRCPYEKAINSRRCNCSQSRRFNLANREGVACKSAAGNLLCNELLNIMRRKARFSLHVTHATSPLPHAKEIKVQVGGLLGLQKLMDPQAGDASTVDDIYGLTNTALGRYTSLDELPFEEIVQSIVVFKGREKRPHPPR
jgi:hypothetical protein